MGYYITLTDADFSIPETPEVLAALHEMETKFDSVKRGGRFGGDGPPERWFSWMPDVRTLGSVREVFEALGFTVEETIDDGIALMEYDNKTGQEGLFLAVVAPFVKDGSYTEWRGEDGALYRYEVRNGRLVECHAEVVWTDYRPYREYVVRASLEDGKAQTISAHVDPYDESTIPV